MIAALLHGRTHLNFQEFRQQNHLTFFLHVLGVLELLQPQVFQSEHQGALWDCLRSFIRLLLVGAPPLRNHPLRSFAAPTALARPLGGGSWVPAGKQRDPCARKAPHFQRSGQTPRFPNRGDSGLLSPHHCASPEPVAQWSGSLSAEVMEDKAL